MFDNTQRQILLDDKKIIIEQKDTLIETYRRMQDDPANLNLMYEHLTLLTIMMDNLVCSYSQLLDDMVKYSDITNGCQK